MDKRLLTATPKGKEISIFADNSKRVYVTGVGVSRTTSGVFVSDIIVLVWNFCPFLPLRLVPSVVCGDLYWWFSLSIYFVCWVFILKTKISHKVNNRKYEIFHGKLEIWLAGICWNKDILKTAKDLLLAIRKSYKININYNIRPKQTPWHGYGISLHVQYWLTHANV